MNLDQLGLVPVRTSPSLERFGEAAFADDRWQDEATIRGAAENGERGTFIVNDVRTNTTFQILSMFVKDPLT
jgi:hypothetical protein